MSTRIRSPRIRYPYYADPRSKTAHLRLEIHPDVKGFGWAGVKSRVALRYTEARWKLDALCTEYGVQ